MTPSLRPTKKERAVANELVFGIHSIHELLKAGRRRLLAIYTTRPEPKGWERIAPLIPRQKIPIQYVTRDVLARMAGTTDHQSVVAYAQPFVFRSKLFEPAQAPFLVMLDGVQDPRNVGAIIRSAYCTGVDGVVLVKKNSAPLNATALKASAGLAEHMAIYQAPSALAAAQELRAQGYQLYLTTFDGQDATQYAYKMPLCVVIGGEGAGISRSILSHGVRITLPQRMPDISYNASVAAGIMLFLIGTQHGRIKKT